MATYYSQGTGNWSTLSNWNDAANGSGSSPVSIAAMDNNAFVIQAGHTITFDVEDSLDCDGSVSGWTTGLNGLTITGVSSGIPGELTLSSTENSVDRIYGLRMKDGMYIQGTSSTVKGRITAGSEGNPIPSNARTIIEMLDPSKSSYGIILANNLIIELYGTGPIEPVYELTSAALATDTQLHVRGLRDHINPNTETEWKAGDTVIICNINKGVSQVKKQLDSINPIGDGVLNLSEAIGVTMAIGAMVCLYNRNIIIRSGPDPSNHCTLIYNSQNIIIDSILLDIYISYSNYSAAFSYGNNINLKGTSIIYSKGICFSGSSNTTVKDRCVLIAVQRGIFCSTLWKITDEVVCCGSYALMTSQSYAIIPRGFEISGNVIIAGCRYAIGNNFGNGIINGNVKVYGSAFGIYNIAGANISNLKIYDCNYGIYDCFNLKLYGCEIGIDAINTTGDIYASGCTLYNTKLGTAGKEIANYSSSTREDAEYFSVISWNHNDIESKYPTAWMPGGTVAPNSLYSPMPDGHTEICEMNFSQPSGMAEGTYNRNWVDIPILIKAGDMNNINLWMTKDTNNMGITPRAAILNYSGDPWLITPIDSYIMTDNTNEQTDTLVYDASSETVDTQVFLRVWGGHTSGTLYWAYTIDRWGAKDTQGFVTG